MKSLLEIDNLRVAFDTANGRATAVDGASLSVDRGEILGLVGESGSGKSVTAQSIMGLESPGQITDGTIHYDGTELTAVSKSDHQQYRGSELAMVFQDPLTTLNPVFDVGDQIAESLRLHDQQNDQSLLDFLQLRPFTDRSAWANCRTAAVELMEQVGIAKPGDRVDAYPHELSGGMCQRVMIAIALAADPELLIVDEPTTALDTTTQARIIERLRRLATNTDTAILVISHDIDVVAKICDRVAVMYGGQVMETGPADRVVDSPEHPYTKGLVGCRITADSSLPLTTIPDSVPDRSPDIGCPFASRCEHATTACRESEPPTVAVGSDHRVSCGELDAIWATDSSSQDDSSVEPIEATHSSQQAQACYDGGRLQKEPVSTTTNGTTESPLFEIRGATKQFDCSASVVDRWLGDERTLTAVDSVDLRVSRGEILGLVGESGSGKSTLAELLAGLQTPTDGEIRFDGNPVGGVDTRTTDQLRAVGVVFQNPQDSINPRLTVRAALAEPLVEAGWSRSERTARVDELLKLVELGPQYASRRPHQLSGGQLQRVAIARAIALEPQVVVLDEPVSALDLSTRATILNLLVDIQERLDLTYIVISHDLGVVRLIADRVAVMYDGRIVERGRAGLVFRQPTHSHTTALVEAAANDYNIGT